ncbi:nucleoside hydrolase-like domain-containing protein [Teredinibacter franksiae]|uniref:nucleoside hydrolase-like domain-containing protein n=1 Tax=Teredinibacter franksiae TaxID=2761453 RepID=UPI0016297E61|nr:nucleoside hydrolase-like domain-containing protein [Teredinibacter franksiae]
MYPDTVWSTEGDSPSFMYLRNPALNDAEKLDQGSWGGRFKTSKSANIKGMECMNSGAYNTHYMHGNTSEGSNAIKKWKVGYDNDFQARMDWAINSNYSSANHHPRIVINNNADEAVMYLNASSGSSVSLNANGSSDPDGDNLSYAWSYYSEPSSYGGSVTINNSSSSNATVQVPSNASGRSIHVILTLRDNGSPNLYEYRRVVINVQ